MKALLIVSIVFVVLIIVFLLMGGKLFSKTDKAEDTIENEGTGGTGELPTPPIDTIPAVQIRTHNTQI